MAKLFSIDGSVKGEIKLPKVFSTPVRGDLIQRAVLAIQSHKRQPYGTDTLAGKRTSAMYLGVKDTHGSMKNREVARGPRIREGPPGLNWTVRFVPHARKGRAPHPPKIEKNYFQKINRKEMAAALASAIAAAADAKIVASRGHRIGGVDVPIVVENLEAMKKSAEIKKLFLALKLEKELARISERKIRAGRGKMRGRRYKLKVGPLIVVSDEKSVCHAAGNLQGVDVVLVKNLNPELLAPGAHAGRLTIWSAAAIKELERFGV